MIETAYNTESSAVTVDFEGRQIHSHDWGTVDTTCDEVKPLIESGALVLITDVHDDAPPALLVTVVRTAAIAGRVETARALDKSDLAELLKGVVADGVSKVQLEWALAQRFDMDIPAPAAPVDVPAVINPPAPDLATEPPAAPEPAKKATARRSPEGN